MERFIYPLSINKEAVEKSNSSPSKKETLKKWEF